MGGLESVDVWWNMASWTLDEDNIKDINEIHPKI